jgi:transposase-like protein
MDATAMTDINEAILKAGRRGHLRWTPEQKQALVEADEASGLSCPRFAALHGVNHQTLVYRFEKSRHGDPRMESMSPREACESVMTLSTIEVAVKFRASAGQVPDSKDDLTILGT